MRQGVEYVVTCKQDGAENDLYSVIIFVKMGFCQLVAKR